MVKTMEVNEQAANEDLTQTVSAEIRLSAEMAQQLVELAASHRRMGSPEQLLRTMVEDHAEAIDQTHRGFDRIERRNHLSDADEIDVEVHRGGTMLEVLISLAAGLSSWRLVPDTIEERMMEIARAVASEVGGDFDRIKAVLLTNDVCVSEFYVPEAKESQRAL